MSFSTKRSFSAGVHLGVPGVPSTNLKLSHLQMQSQCSHSCFLYFSVRRAVGIALNVTQEARSGCTFILGLTCPKHRSWALGHMAFRLFSACRYLWRCRRQWKGWRVGLSAEKAWLPNYLVIVHFIEWSFCFRIKNFHCWRSSHFIDLGDCISCKQPFTDNVFLSSALDKS